MFRHLMQSVYSAENLHEYIKFCFLGKKIYTINLPSAELAQVKNISLPRWMTTHTKEISTSWKYWSPFLKMATANRKYFLPLVTNLFP